MSAELQDDSSTDQSPTLTLATPIQYLSGVGPERAGKLLRMRLRTAQDLLFFFPRDYEFPAPHTQVPDLRDGAPASLIGTITDAELVSRTAGKSVYGVLVENDSGAVRCLFFNQPFRAEQLTLGRRVVVSGKAKLNGLRMEFVHPNVTILDEKEYLPQTRILPIYPLTEGIKQSDMRRVISDTTRSLANEISEVMPTALREQAADALRLAGALRCEDQLVLGPLPSIDDSLLNLHCPVDHPSLTAARTRLVFQELLVMQLALALRRRQLTTDLKAAPLTPSAMIDARILKRFPFELTGDQKRVIKEIGEDMSRQFPMNRLLQGDVGSGKTVIAIYAMMLAAANGYQAVLMAPTEILARQHFQTLSAILAESRVSVGLLCGSLTASERRDVLSKTASGEMNLLVGTQSLLFGIDFARLGLCVIDEQHKFGVAQRVTLRSGGVDPHYLVMSATPIPRSVAMTIFGDVDLSSLLEKPPGRVNVNTYLAKDGWKERWWSFLKKQIDEGRQAYVVAPRVDAPTSVSGNRDSDNQEADESSEDVSSVLSVFRQLSEETLSDYEVGLLHGRMAPEEKQAVMQSFSAGDIDVLVSTTVIEVGIDVPNATVMTILGAQRFGLAQLHQLRGRVSRGDHAGHVCVFTDGPQSPEENERLQVFEQTDNGFELAEADFQMRGPGELLGRRQSGLPEMRIADLSNDVLILGVAREVAQAMIDEDPKLSASELAGLREQVMRRYGKRLELGDVA